MAYLQIENFYKSFGDVEVLKGISLTLEKGEVLSIIGSSGSGKTTLLRCINMLETTNSGVMTLDGKTILNSQDSVADTEKTLREKRLNFGLVFQSFNLFPQYSVIQNVTLAPTLLLEESLKTYKKELKAKVKTGEIKKKDLKALLKSYETQEKQKILQDGEELLAKTGLTDKRNSFPCQLSGGQCQRVAIARALALKPKILCFDEPTSALDPELTGEVLKVIRSLKNDDITMIIVTHEMGFAKNVSDKVIFMADGLVEETGSPKELFDNPKSSKLKAFICGLNNKDGE